MSNEKNEKVVAGQMGLEGSVVGDDKSNIVGGAGGVPGMAVAGGRANSSSGSVVGSQEAGTSSVRDAGEGSSLANGASEGVNEVLVGLAQQMSLMAKKLDAIEQSRLQAPAVEEPARLPVQQVVSSSDVNASVKAESEALRQEMRKMQEEAKNAREEMQARLEAERLRGKGKNTQDIMNAVQRKVSAPLPSNMKHGASHTLKTDFVYETDAAEKIIATIRTKDPSDITGKICSLAESNKVSPTDILNLKWEAHQYLDEQEDKFVHCGLNGREILRATDEDRINLIEHRKAGRFTTLKEIVNKRLQSQT